MVSKKVVVSSVLILLLVIPVVLLVKEIIYASQFPPPGSGPYSISKKDIELECQSLCPLEKREDLIVLSETVEYCTKTFSYDVISDGAVVTLYEQGYDSFCEDGIFCFHMLEDEECEVDGEPLDADLCREKMCEYFTLHEFPGEFEEFEDGEDLVQAVEERIHRIMEDRKGSCDLEELEDASGLKIDTWYSKSGSEDFVLDDTGICGEKWVEKAEEVHDELGGR